MVGCAQVPEHRCASILLLGAAAAVACAASAHAAAGRTPSRACAPISAKAADGTYSYAVRVEGDISCAVARRMMRAAADVWPPDSGWKCAIGSAGSAWAISCTKGPNLIRAYGPILVRAAPAAAASDPWSDEARALGGVLYKPAFTAALRLTGLAAHPCSGVKLAVVADYGTEGGTTLTVAEGDPSTCGQLGAPPQLATWRIHGRPARLAEFCAPTGCSRLSGEYSLDWREGGREITLMTHNFGLHDLLAVARSMTRIS